MVYYRLAILQCDGLIRVTAVTFESVETAEYHAQLLSKSAGIEQVTIIECRDYLTLFNSRTEDLVKSLMLG